MKSRTGNFRLGVMTLAVLTLSVASVVSHAQQNGGPPPGGPGGFGGPGPGGGRGFGGRIQPATVPIEVLTSELRLTATQAEKIKAIQSTYNKERNALMPNGGRGFGGPGGQGGPGGPGGGPGRGGQGGPPPHAPGAEGQGPGGDEQGPGGGQGGGQGGPGGGPGGGGGGQGFNREEMQARMQKMQALDKATNDKIDAVLTGEQKAMLPGLIQLLGSLQSAGIQPHALAVLNLNSDQKKRAVTIGRETDQAVQEAMQDRDFQAIQAARTKGREKIQALLTADQKTALAKFAKDHPQPRFGGPGGPGDRQGGPGGPGRPGGGPGGQGGDGPPPPPDGNGPPPAN